MSKRRPQTARKSMHGAPSWQFASSVPARPRSGAEEHVVQPPNGHD